MAKELDRKYGIKTTDLYIVPQTREELRELISMEKDETLKAELEAILARCEEHPEDGIWYTYWKACRRKDRSVHTGGFWFMGKPVHGTCEVRFYILEEFRGKKFATQGLRELTEWAFANKVYTIEATVEAHNSSAAHVLDRSGYVYRNGDKNIHNYSVEKPRTSWTGLYLIIGIFAGLALGIVFASVAVGLVVGVMLSVVLGGSMDYSASKEREEITGEKYMRRKLRKGKKEE